MRRSSVLPTPPQDIHYLLRPSHSPLPLSPRRSRSRSIELNCRHRIVGVYAPGIHSKAIYIFAWPHPVIMEAVDGFIPVRQPINVDAALAYLRDQGIVDYGTADNVEVLQANNGMSKWVHLRTPLSAHSIAHCLLSLATLATLVYVRCLLCHAL